MSHRDNRRQSYNYEQGNQRHYQQTQKEAWVALTAAYNAKCGSFPKQKEQLKLKWDNLKKMARKRAQKVRMNSLKTGGGKPDFIPPDELLEKVTSLLGSTCTGFDVPFGGDGLGVGMVLELEVGGLELQNQSDHCEPETEGNVVLCPSPKRDNKTKHHVRCN
ncbi:uncharacterized protein LOC114251467 [Bombyx mandarina]|uniref:Regulatory protein zeste n=2 Tax=Bombyx TaxID=7090 RepID=A0A8R2M843_BOMMO|nr:uncharacterized protein LOC114251467 [Bombyx mandarina]XP_037875931.1 uncharacterized protein LOC119630477 [Bombyx mori]